MHVKKNIQECSNITSRLQTKMTFKCFDTTVFFGGTVQSLKNRNSLISHFKINFIPDSLNKSDIFLIYAVVWIVFVPKH